MKETESKLNVMPNALIYAFEFIFETNFYYYQKEKMLNHMLCTKYNILNHTEVYGLFKDNVK